MSQYAQIQHEEGIALLRFHNPPQNAFHGEIMTELRAHLQKLEKQKETKAVIITGHGKYFCTGLDLQWFTQQDTEQITTFTQEVQHFVRELFLFQSL